MTRPIARSLQRRKTIAPAEFSERTRETPCAIDRERRSSEASSAEALWWSRNASYERKRNDTSRLGNEFCARVSTAHAPHRSDAWDCGLCGSAGGRAIRELWGGRCAGRPDGKNSRERSQHRFFPTLPKRLARRNGHDERLRGAASRDREHAWVHARLFSRAVPDVPRATPYGGRAHAESFLIYVASAAQGTCR